MNHFLNKIAVVMVVAFFIAVFLAFFIEYLGRLKNDDPDRYHQLREGLKLRRRK